MIYNPMIDTPPDSFGGVAVKTDFRQVLEFFRIVDDSDMEEEEKALRVIEIFFDEFPKYDHDRMWEFIEWYLMCGQGKEKATAPKKEDAERKRKEDLYGKQEVEKDFDWDFDAGRIYAAFLQVYGIDLSGNGLRRYMHWWEFKALFDALPSDTKLMEVVEIRKRPLPKDPKDTTRGAISRMRNAYKIRK